MQYSRQFDRLHRYHEVNLSGKSNKSLQQEAQTKRLHREQERLKKKSAIRIQALFRSYQCRKKLKTIFQKRFDTLSISNHPFLAISLLLRFYDHTRDEKRQIELCKTLNTLWINTLSNIKTRLSILFIVPINDVIEYRTNIELLGNLLELLVLYIGSRNTNKENTNIIIDILNTIYHLLLPYDKLSNYLKLNISNRYSEKLIVLQSIWYTMLQKPRKKINLNYIIEYFYIQKYNKFKETGLCRQYNNPIEKLWQLQEPINCDNILLNKWIDEIINYKQFDIYLRKIKLKDINYELNSLQELLYQYIDSIIPRTSFQVLIELIKYYNNLQYIVYIPQYVISTNNIPYKMKEFYVANYIINIWMIPHIQYKYIKNIWMRPHIQYKYIKNMLRDNETIFDIFFDIQSGHSDKLRYTTNHYTIYQRLFIEKAGKVMGYRNNQQDWDIEIIQKYIWEELFFNRQNCWYDIYDGERCIDYIYALWHGNIKKNAAVATTTMATTNDTANRNDNNTVGTNNAVDIKDKDTTDSEQTLQILQKQGTSQYVNNNININITEDSYEQISHLCIYIMYRKRYTIPYRILILQINLSEYYDTIDSNTKEHIIFNIITLQTTMLYTCIPEGYRYMNDIINLYKYEDDGTIYDDIVPLQQHPQYKFINKNIVDTDSGSTMNEKEYREEVEEEEEDEEDEDEEDEEEKEKEEGEGEREEGKVEVEEGEGEGEGEREEERINNKSKFLIKLKKKNFINTTTVNEKINNKPIIIINLKKIFDTITSNHNITTNTIKKYIDIPIENSILQEYFQLRYRYKIQSYNIPLIPLELNDINCIEILWPNLSVPSSVVLNTNNYIKKDIKYNNTYKISEDILYQKMDTIYSNTSNNKSPTIWGQYLDKLCKLYQSKNYFIYIIKELLNELNKKDNDTIYWKIEMKALQQCILLKWWKTISNLEDFFINLSIPASIVSLITPLPYILSKWLYINDIKYDKILNEINIFKEQKKWYNKNIKILNINCKVICVNNIIYNFKHKIKYMIVNNINTKNKRYINNINTKNKKYINNNCIWYCRILFSWLLHIHITSIELETIIKQYQKQDHDLSKIIEILNISVLQQYCNKNILNNELLNILSKDHLKYFIEILQCLRYKYDYRIFCDISIWALPKSIKYNYNNKQSSIYELREILKHVTNTFFQDSSSISSQYLERFQNLRYNSFIQEQEENCWLIQKLPSLQTFQERVSLFFQQITLDKQKQLKNEGQHQQRTSQAFEEYRQAINIQIRRFAILDDLIKLILSLNPIHLRRRFHVMFIDKFGIVEEGQDGGGLYKELQTIFWKTLLLPSNKIFTILSNDQRYMPYNNVSIDKWISTAIYFWEPKIILSLLEEIVYPRKNIKIYDDRSPFELMNDNFIFNTYLEYPIPKLFPPVINNINNSITDTYNTSSLAKYRKCLLPQDDEISGQLKLKRQMYENKSSYKIQSIIDEKDEILEMNDITITDIRAEVQCQQELYYLAGIILGKCLYDGIQVEPLFSIPFLRLVLQQTINKLENVQEIDIQKYNSLLYIQDHPNEVSTLGLTFSTSIETERMKDGTIDIIPNGSTISIDDKTRIQYAVRLADYTMNQQIYLQTKVFIDGLTSILQPSWITLFTPMEFSQLISGTGTININDLEKYTLYSGGFTKESQTIIWLWELLQEFDQPMKALFLQFITSCSRAPLLGFKSLSPQFCIQKNDSAGSTTKLPTASTCFNLLRLPEYSSKDELSKKLCLAIQSDSGFHLA